MAALIPMVRRIVAARVSDDATADDLVQETLTRVLAAAERVEPGMLEPYAIATARNVVVNLWREQDRHRRNQHRVVDVLPSDALDEGLLADEQRAARRHRRDQAGEQRVPRLGRQVHELCGNQVVPVAGDLRGDVGVDPRDPVGDLGPMRLRVRPGGLQRRAGEVDGRHLPAALGQPDGIGPLATADVQRRSGRQVGGLGDQLGVWLPAPQRVGGPVPLLEGLLVVHQRTPARLRAATASRMSSAIRSAFSAAAAFSPAAAEAITCARRSATLPAAHTPGTTVSPIGFAGT